MSTSGGSFCFPFPPSAPPLPLSSACLHSVLLHSGKQVWFKTCPVQVQTHKHPYTQAQGCSIGNRGGRGHCLVVQQVLWPQETWDNGCPCLMQGQRMHTHCEHTVSHCTNLAQEPYVRKGSGVSPSLPQAFLPVLFVCFCSLTIYTRLYFIISHFPLLLITAFTQPSHPLMTSGQTELSINMQQTASK